MAIVTAEIRFAPQLASWFTANPTLVLADGELAYCSDGANAGKYKLGDGTTALSALTFYGGVSSSGLTIGTTTITSGTNTRILYNNAGVVGEYLVTGTGTTAVLSTSPTISTSLVLNGYQDLGTIATPTLANGRFYYNQGTDGFVFYTNDATNSEYHTQWKNSSAALGVYLSNAGGTQVQFGSTTNHALGFYVNGGSPKIRIATTGNVGINLTTDAGYELEVSGQIAASGNIRSTGTRGWLLGEVAGVARVGYFSGQFEFTTAANTFASIKSANGIFTTDITTPLIIGGSAVGSVIKYKGTSGNGTSTVAAHQFLVGNNGATTALNVYNSGQVLFNGSTLPGGSLSQVRITKGTGIVDIGEWASGRGGIWFNLATPTVSNFHVGANTTGTDGYLNGSTASRLLANGNIIVSAFPTQVTFLPSAATGSTVNFDFTVPSNTSRTASTNVSNFIVRGGSSTFNSGALTNWYASYFSTPTLAFGGASTATNAYTVFFDSITVGTLATITNNYSLGTAGKAKFGGNVELTQTVTTEVVVSDTTVTVVINGTTYKLLAKA